MSQLRPLFGGDYLNACGYDEDNVQLYKGGNIQISIPFRVERRLTSSAAIMKDSEDIKGLCKALHVTEREMLTLQLSGLKNFEKLVKFLKDNVTSNTLVISVYIITHEIETRESKGIEEKNIKQIDKILLGHHVLICIPVDQTLRTDTVEDIIQNGIDFTPEVLESFQQEAIAIFDFEEFHKKTGANIIKDSKTYEFDGETKALFAQLTEEGSLLFIKNSSVELYFYFALFAGGIALLSMTLGSGKK